MGSQGIHHILLPNQTFQILPRDSEAFPGQTGNIISPAVSWLTQNTYKGSRPRRDLNQMPEPPQLAPFDQQEQQLYSKIPPEVWAQPPFRGSFSHHPDFMTIVEGCNINQWVNWKLWFFWLITISTVQYNAHIAADDSLAHAPPFHRLCITPQDTWTCLV